MSALLLILGLILFVGLVVVHELGHFIVARRNGVEVEEFGIGFPPRAWGKKLKNGVLFSLNWLPLGGFVKMKGEHDADTEKGTYGAASLKSKVKILLAGVGMNLLAAFIFLTILAWVGMPQIIDNQFTVASDTKVIKDQILIGNVDEGSPADIAGLRRADQIVAIGPAGEIPKNISASEDIPPITERNAGKNITIKIKRKDKEIELAASLRLQAEVETYNKEHHCGDENYTGDDADCMGYLGVVPTRYVLQQSVWSAPIVAGGLIKQFTEITFRGLGHALAALFSGNGKEASQQVAGPVGIFVLLKDGSLIGYEFILLVIALISLTLAIMNVLPIPALDGGRLFVTLLFRALKKPLTEKKEDLIHGTGFAMLLGLFVLITVVDVRRFF